MVDLIATARDTHEEVQIGRLDDQHVADLLRFCKGWHKFAPFVGVCLLEVLNDEQSSAQLRSRIASELQEDGATPRRIEVSSDGQIKIDATYG